jgi:hypothetical protein
MPYRLRWEGHGIYRRFFGVLTASEFLQAYDEMTRDVRYEGLRYIISDFLQAIPGPDLTEDDLKAFAELERLRFYDSPDTVRANVVADPETLKYVKFYESLGIAPYCMNDFRTVGEARHWIASNPRAGWVRPPTSAAEAAHHHG